jgi:hypothetical protein
VLEEENTTMPEQLSPEEQRREMRRRFDATNKTADDLRETRRDIDAVKQSEEKKRRSTSDAGAQQQNEPGQNTGETPAD